MLLGSADYSFNVFCKKMPDNILSINSVLFWINLKVTGWTVC